MGKIMKEGKQYGVGGGERILRTVITDTTTSAGVIATSIPFAKLVCVGVETTGVNYYCNARTSSDGMAVIFVWNNQFQAVANTTLSVAVTYME